MRPIDADNLKEAIKESQAEGFVEVANAFDCIYGLINNASTLGYEDGILSVENATRKAIELEEAYNNGWSDGFSDGVNERPKGEWIFHKDFNESCRYGCNQCGNLNNILSNFCPNCGADMRDNKNDMSILKTI